MPVIVNGYVPAASVDPVVIVRLEPLKLGVAPEGSPVAPNATVPLKPLLGVTVTE